jgi:hypothetical protein
MATRCPRCGRERSAADRFCPGCGDPGAPAAPPAAEAPAAGGRFGIEASIPLLTAGTTLVATGAGLRGDMPALGVTILVGGIALMLAPLAQVLRPLLRGGPPKQTRRAVLGAVAALAAGAVLGAVVLLAIGPRLRGDGTPAALGCANLEAVRVAEALRAAGLPVADVAPLPGAAGAAPGPRLAGAPVSAAAFRDTTIADDGPDGLLPDRAPTDGGIVEVFPDPAAAAAPNRPFAPGDEHRIVAGPVVLRLPAAVPDPAATAYEDALRAAVACDGPVPG